MERIEGSDPVPHHFVILDFLVEIVGPSEPTAGSDAAEAAWVPLDDLGAFDLVDGLRAFLEEVGVLP